MYINLFLIHKNIYIYKCTYFIDILLFLFFIQIFIFMLRQEIGKIMKQISTICSQSNHYNNNNNNNNNKFIIKFILEYCSF